jgi:hypothetical protein
MVIVTATKPISYEVITMARWLARKAIKAELRAAGLRPEHVAVSEIAAAADAYFSKHRGSADR